MPPDLWSLYGQMLRSRLFEEAVRRLWQEGAISGEMHLGTGEEAIVAGVVSQLVEGDAMALDHRGTAALLVRGVDPLLLLREFLGRPDGLCRGMGGHMHLFSPEHLAASSGIVGASGPAAVGLALAALHLRPGTLAVAFFGEGATNQGMLMEAMNLAVAWQLPVLFVCKVDDWAITTRSPSVTGGRLMERARGFGMAAVRVDGGDALATWAAANDAMARARGGGGPTFLHARCLHLEGHFLGDPLLRLARQPAREAGAIAGPLLRSVAGRGGASWGRRAASLASVMGVIRGAWGRRRAGPDDPILRTRRQLAADAARLRELEGAVEEEIRRVVEKALEPAEQGEETCP